MKERTYTVYYLEEDLSPTGKPYVGMTSSIKRRSKQHRDRLGLDYIPILYPIKEFNDPEEAYSFEQNKRVEHGLKREKGSYKTTLKASKRGGEVAGPLVVKNKRGIYGMSEEEKFRYRSEGGNNCVKEKKGIWSLSKETRFEINSRVGKMMLGKRWINNGTINKIVHPEKLEYYYSQGFVNGRFKK